MRLSLVLALMTFASSFAAPILNPRLAADCSNSSCDHVSLSSGDPIPSRTSHGHSFPRLEKRIGMAGKRVSHGGGRRNNGEKPILDIKQEKFGDRRETRLSRGVIGLVNFFGNKKVQEGIKNAWGKFTGAMAQGDKNARKNNEIYRKKSRTTNLRLSALVA